MAYFASKPRAKAGIRVNYCFFLKIPTKSLFLLQVITTSNYPLATLRFQDKKQLERVETQIQKQKYVKFQILRAGQKTFRKFEAE